MSTESIERYIQELESIKNYSQVKREKEQLLQKVEGLRLGLDAALNEISSLKSSKAKLDGAQITLEEARLDFIRAQDAEIEKRATSRLEMLKADYESRMPQLVYGRLSDILKKSQRPEEIAMLIDAEAKKKVDAILGEQKSWPQWFKECYEQEVNKKVNARLNQESHTRVETEAVAKARQRLDELIATEWPAWYRSNVDPKVSAMEKAINIDVVRFLLGPWILVCDQCKNRFEVELTASGIRDLVSTGRVHIECTNPRCEDHGWLSSSRHSLPVSLHDLIELRVSG